MVELLNPLYIIINIFILIFITINHDLRSVLCLCGGGGVIPPFRCVCAVDGARELSTIMRYD